MAKRTKVTQNDVTLKIIGAFMGDNQEHDTSNIDLPKLSLKGAIQRCANFHPFDATASNSFNKCEHLNVDFYIQVLREYQYQYSSITRI
jgi:hypothetical protein